MFLFRTEAIEHQQDQWKGEVLITRLPGQVWWVAVACIIALAIIAFASIGSYTRKEHIVGVVWPSAGLVKVSSMQAGTVSSVLVAEGQAVKRGDVVLTLGSQKILASARDSLAQAQEELRARRTSVEGELVRQKEMEALAVNVHEQRVESLMKQKVQIAAQIEKQRGLAANARQILKQYEQLYREKYVSQMALIQKRNELLLQESQLNTLAMNAETLAMDLARARSDVASSGPKSDSNVAAVARQISEIDQQLAEAESRSGLSIVAPADGIVTAIVVENGQLAAPGATLLSILPTGSELQAHLLLPTRAAGFVQPGQQVALRFQSFAYQRFGHHLGRIEQMGKAVIQPNENPLPVAIQEPFYRVVVSLPQQNVQAYGKAIPLRAGMQLDADISVDRRRIIEWLFDPLLSVTGRL